MSQSQTVLFHQISRILELTDSLEISREAVEIPLTPASPGIVRRLNNGKLEIVVDAEVTFEEWLPRLAERIREIMPKDSQSNQPGVPEE